MKRRRAAAAGATLVLFTLMGAAPAFAYQTATLKGTGQARVYNNSSNAAKVGAWDDVSDHNPVYARYYRKASASTQRNLWNKTGAGTETYSGTGSSILKAKICESQMAQPDDCSVYVAMKY